MTKLNEGEELLNRHADQWQRHIEKRERLATVAERQFSDELAQQIHRSFDRQAVEIERVQERERQELFANPSTNREEPSLADQWNEVQRSHRQGPDREQDDPEVGHDR